MEIRAEAQPAFRHAGGQMFVEEVPLEALHRAVGACYVYSRAAVDARVSAVQTAFAGRADLIAYAVKANTNHTLMEFLCARGLGAEVVSEMEIAAALAAGFPASRLICNGNGKSVEDLRAAFAAGAAVLNLDGAWELRRLEQAARDAGRRQDVLLRVNPDLDPTTHPYIATGMKSSKFGMDFDEARRVVDSAADFPNLRLCGLHVHMGSQLKDPQPIRDAFERVREFGTGLEGPGFRFEILNLGGGFGVDYAEQGGDLDLRRLAAGLDAPGFWAGRRLILEPGRYLVADCGVLLGQVLGVKTSHGHKFVIVDLGMNDLIRPALYDAYHAIVPVRPRPGAAETVEIVGPICESGDFLARGRELGPVEPGDLIAVKHAGAYGASMASNYNGRPRLPEVWVEGAKAYVTRRRETREDLIRLDCHEPIRL